jgi:hypothetical protein
MRNPEIKITQRNVTGMRQCNPREVLALTPAKIIIMLAIADIISLFAVMAGA